MPEKYFDKFRIINYNNTPVRNITQRAVVLNAVYSSPVLFYPYDIQQGERPDNIADRYYKDQYQGWILHLTNKVVDPYYDWYLDQATFSDFIIKKYGSLANATSKVKYYRNNWYSDSNVIPTSSFDILDPTLQKFYEPVYADPDMAMRILGYKRKPIDWKRSTNAIVSYNCDGTDFIHDEIVDVYSASTKVGYGQVCGKTSTVLTIQHTSGNVTLDTGPGPFSVVGRESGTTKTYTNATLVVNNIPAGESVYWEPVYYYDYENEINERNKTIQVLKREYSGKISKELKTLMK